MTLIFAFKMNSLRNLYNVQSATWKIIWASYANIYNCGIEGKGKGKNNTIKNEVKRDTDFLFGINPIYSALSSQKRDFIKAYLKKDIFQNKFDLKLEKIQHLLMQHCIQTEFVSKPILNQLSYNRPHQGIVMEAAPLSYTILNIDMCYPATQSSFWVYLYKIKDPMNLGAIIRTCYYFGVDKVVVSATDSCPLTPVVSKASSGAMEIMDLYRVEEDLPFLHKLKEYQWQILSTTEPPKNFSSSNKRILTTHTISALDKPTVLIFGNEGDGIPENVKEFSDSYLTIPSPYDKAGGWVKN